MKKLIVIIAALTLSFGCILLAGDEGADAGGGGKPSKKGHAGGKSSTYEGCMNTCNTRYDSCMKSVYQALATGKKVDEKKITKKCTAEKNACESKCSREEDDAVK